MADNTKGKTVHITSEKVAELAKSTNEKPGENSTIFDDVLKTIQEKIPELAVPLINEIFGTDYPADIPVIPWRQEHHTRNGKIYVDTHLLIGKKHYHLEYQIKNDGTMAIRMWEYDAAIALENVEKENGKYRIRFPNSCVLQLRGKNRFDRLEMEVIFQDGQTMTYSVPVIWLSDYTKDKIFQKRLIFLLPFYTMRSITRFS